jgi:hypothetical protein
VLFRSVFIEAVAEHLSSRLSRLSRWFSDSL